MKPVRVYVSIGGNVEPQSRLPTAARALRQRFPTARFSGVYRNPAFGFEGADFFNAVVGFDTILSVAELLSQLHAVEAECGRRRDDPKWAPRTMDLDLLLYGDVVGDGPGYTLPRRDLTQRIYMLGPLAELAPECWYPPSGPSIGELWARYPRQEPGLTPVALDLNRV